MRRLAIGDIHGNLKALQSAMSNANYRPENDYLYFVGDYIDRHPHSRQVVDFIMDLPNTICIRGNHDQFIIDFLKQPEPDRILSPVWEDNGARSTLKSYGFEIFRSGDKLIASKGHISDAHVKFFESLKAFHITDDNLALVHGGFDLEMQDMSINFVIWDRLMWKTAKEGHMRGDASFPCFRQFKKIFIGHTNLLSFQGQQECLPQKRLNVWNIDTGAGFTGPLTIMDMDTEEYWQSEN